MVDHFAKIPATLQVIDDELFGRAVIGWALLEPSELPTTILELKTDFPVFAAAFDLTHADDNETLVFDQGTETEHRISLPALNKLVPMIELYYQKTLDEFKITGSTIRPDVKPSNDYALVDPPGGTLDYALPDFFERATEPTTSPTHLSTDSEEFFFNRVGDYSFAGCR